MNKKPIKPTKKHAAKILKYRVDGCDTFEGPNAFYSIGEYDTAQEAIEVCEKHGGVMNPCYAYAPDGQRIHKSGSY